MGQINLKTRQQCLGYKKEQEFFLTSSETYSRIDCETLIRFCSENSGIAKAQMSAAFYALCQQMEQFLLNGHSLELLNLGTLYLTVKAKATETEEEAGAKAVKRISVKFRQSKKLRDLINSNVKLVSALTDSKSTGSLDEVEKTDTPNDSEL